ncbi:uncharacterized protein KY384_005923 [Bacidia gigantensis]|uniref:uncharacterized protein n=1 Tax=Bacidia gigantensis TaxID=2732470 RepID=UPI001D048966|nr:uncharacterized protein KY384_005923 [Bacidia gigantensis]KAG8529288.1 hypothetical protein KY384_005923 [Bacidia gigantensis]
MEARIKNILKGIRKLKHPEGHLMILSFEKLPDKTDLPDYYIEIKEPLAIEQIKRKAKRKKYHSVDHFLRDMDVMFNNCKSYNMEDSQVYKDAVSLQAETHKLAKEETSKPDTEFALEEGRLPLPEGILYNEELWKIGDWIHVQNPNDVTKPVVAQVYRTWQDGDGDKWINACWYYRPEQTVHQFEKHFFPNEVVKTGQYRDHRIDEIVDRCFVMFVTRYSRGRPRGLGVGKEVYVCESRYNEEKHRFNKIKTWASCLPDEVRDKDYEMDLFDAPKKIRKVPSPLLHLLKDEGTEANANPRWGVKNAPPIVGAVFKGPRDENQSPPPEPTPSPPPPQTTKPKSMSYNTPDYRATETRAASSNASHINHAASYGSSQLPQYHGSSTSPAPLHHPHQFTQQAASGYTQPSQHYGTAQNRFAPPERTQSSESSYQRSDEVYRLPGNANLAIPEEIRNQFQQDEHGHVLFFTAPPIDTLPPVKPGSAIGHTARYLADKLRTELAAKEKEKAGRGPLPKRAKQAEDELELSQQIQTTSEEALQLLIKQMHNGRDQIYKDLCGEHWEERKRHEDESLKVKQAKAKKERAELEESRGRRTESRQLTLVPGTVFKDDWDPRTFIVEDKYYTELALDYRIFRPPTFAVFVGHVRYTAWVVCQSVQTDLWFTQERSFGPRQVSRLNNGTAESFITLNPIS